ncbi:MAG: DEAD/DEAH box helicase family protein [Acidimicrobiales bacterium]
MAARRLAGPDGPLRPHRHRFGRDDLPRFHQWDAVLRLEADARENGPGSSYLVQHSAGSGKSNTIAWLAHRLSSLHAGDDKVFDKVVVITDRLVLDRQLQETIYQFEHAHGVVEKIDQDSAQLATALTGERARIIITTLQKFPFVMRHVEELKQRSYAVIIDEAHSSQTGDAAKEMKKVLGATGADPAAELRAAEAAEAGATDEVPDPVEDALATEVAARGRQPNLSFFAFTATPKGRTLELFGRKNPATGKFEPFHLYSMRQAIQEGFILDVLANYVTYDTYFKIDKAIADDPELDSARARSAIARFVSLHESNLAQRAEVIVEHFRHHVAHRIGGKAKAMVVTASRLHALRYKQALDRYCSEHGIGDVNTLVAFSGSLQVDGEELTEAKVNGFPDSQTPAEFDTDAWQILVVAEKYQTGFDQPKLYAMYVDKTLTGLAAVQTLSRLNRTRDGKTGTFVLDFRNSVEDIQTSFEPWYAHTVAPPTDPHLLYDTHAELGPFGVLAYEEVESVVALLLTDPDTNHERINAGLQPAVDRFAALDEDRQDEFRDVITRFVRIYSFLSQVVSFTDVKLERDYLFCRALSRLIKRDPGSGVDLGGAVELTHLAMEKTYEGDGSLDVDGGEVVTIYGGTGRRQDPDEVPLSEIIAKINERFGTNITDTDRLFTDQVANDLVADPKIQVEAAANDEASFGVGFDKTWINALHWPLGANEDFGFQLDNDDSGRRCWRSTGPTSTDGLRRPTAHLPHRRAHRPRPRRPVPRVQVDHAVGREEGREGQVHRGRSRQDHRRVRQLPLRRDPARRCHRRRRNPRPRRRLRHLLQARRARRPRPVGPTPQDPARPTRQVRRHPRRLGVPHHQRRRDRPHLRRPVRPPRLRDQRRPTGLLVAHARQHRRHRRRSRTTAHHRPAVGLVTPRP